jgi:hypothetical protein
MNMISCIKCSTKTKNDNHTIILRDALNGIIACH